MRDLTLIPVGGSHMDDMWGATGEPQLYTFNGKPIAALRPGFFLQRGLYGGEHRQHRGESPRWKAVLRLSRLSGAA
jgi:hypothetical protein